MVRVVEYRICMPMSMEEFQRGMTYTTAKTSDLTSGDGQGVETLERKVFEDANAEDPRMECGVYTHKILHMGPRVPKLVRMLTPKDALMLDEKSWDCYPYIKTVYASEYFGKRFELTVETMVVEDDRGEHPNALNLSEEVLKLREVDYVDIVQDEVPAGSIMGNDEDPSKFRSATTGRGPLAPEFEQTCDPVLCIYKVVRCNFDFGPFQKKAEALCQSAGMRDLLVPFHRQVFCWIDEWYPMTMEEVALFEKKCFDKLNEVQYGQSKRGELKAGDAVGRVKDEDFLSSPSQQRKPD